MEEIPPDIQQVVLAYLSSIDDYDSFDCDLLARRRSRDPEEWTLFCLKAASRGDRAKLVFGWGRMDPAERRWVLYAAAAANRIPILGFIDAAGTQSAAAWRGGLYWASLKGHYKAAEFIRRRSPATRKKT